MNEYKNLKIISRDRGFSYKNLSDKYIHIADKFHLIMNLSEILIKDIKRRMPRAINVSLNKEKKEEKEIEIEIETQSLSSKQLEKKELILELKRKYKEGNSCRKLAMEYKLDRKTVGKYINSIDIDDLCIYDSSNRDNGYLEPYKEEIMELFCKYRNKKKIYNMLIEQGIQLTYSTLSRYIRIKLQRPIVGNSKEQYEEQYEELKLNRSKIIKHILNWIPDEQVNKNESILFTSYPFLEKYKEFYREFSLYLKNQENEHLVELLEKEYKEECLNKFINSLKSDWDAVINASKYKISNGITEGCVNKIKQIKRDMYGRASYKLLRNKVIYQSLFLEPC